MTMVNDSLPPPLINAPPNVFYLPDFISVQEEAELLGKVLGAPKPKWVQLKNRSNRLQNWGGVVSPKGMVGEPLPAWLTAPLFDRLKQLKVFTTDDGTSYVPNHVLINEYHPGQGIMPHLDGPAYFPTVATVSLGSHCVLEFFKCHGDEGQVQGTEEMIGGVHHGKDTPDMNKDIEDRSLRKPDFSLLVQPRSLLVLKKDVYTGYMHGIREITEDDLTGENIVNMEQQPAGLPSSLKRGTRISLTLRKVERVLSASRFLKK